MNEKIHEHYEEMKIYFKVNNLSPKTFISKFQSIDFDYQFDIGVIGTSCSGKTSIIHFFKSGIKLDFPLAHFNMNMGYFKKKIDNNICKITFLDFPGNKKSFDFWIEYLLNLHAIILVFSLVEDIYGGEEYFFKTLNYYLNAYKDNNIKKKKFIYLVGNKVDDKKEKQISKDIIKKFATEYSLPYFETSAFTGENINEVFENLILNLIKIYPKK